MLLLITECQNRPCYLIRTGLSLELHVDVTLTNINLACDRCSASHAMASEANIVLTLEICF